MTKTKYPKAKKEVVTYTTVDAIAAAILCSMDHPEDIVKGAVKQLLLNAPHKITQGLRDQAVKMKDYVYAKVGIDILTSRKVSSFNLDLAKH